MMVVTVDSIKTARRRVHVASREDSDSGSTLFTGSGHVLPLMCLKLLVDGCK